jgi:hypothetical protein
MGPNGGSVATDSASMQQMFTSSVSVKMGQCTDSPDQPGVAAPPPPILCFISGFVILYIFYMAGLFCSIDPTILYEIYTFLCRQDIMNNEPMVDFKKYFLLLTLCFKDLDKAYMEEGIMQDVCNVWKQV